MRIFTFGTMLGVCVTLLLVLVCAHAAMVDPVKELDRAIARRASEQDDVLRVEAWPVHECFKKHLKQREVAEGLTSLFPYLRCARYQREHNLDAVVVGMYVSLADMQRPGWAGRMQDTRDLLRRLVLQTDSDHREVLLHDPLDHWSVDGAQAACYIDESLWACARVPVVNNTLQLCSVSVAHASSALEFMRAQWDRMTAGYTRTPALDSGAAVPRKKR